MKIVVPKELFEAIMKIAEAEKLSIRHYLKQGNEFSVEDAKDISGRMDLFNLFFEEFNKLDGAENIHFIKQCKMAFKTSIDNELLAFILKLLVIIMSINYLLVMPGALPICNCLREFKLDCYADSQLTDYFKCIVNLVVAKLIIRPEFDFHKSSEYLSFGFSCIKLAHDAAISNNMPEHRLGVIYFTLAAYCDAASKRQSQTSVSDNGDLQLAYNYIDRGLSNLGKKFLDIWRTFQVLHAQLLKNPPLKLALAHPDAFDFLTHIMMTTHYMPLFSHEQCTADILRQLCDRRNYWLLMQKYNIQELIDCCTNAEYFSLLSQSHVKQYIINNNLSLAAYQHIPLHDIIAISNGDKSDVSSTSLTPIRCL